MSASLRCLRVVQCFLIGQRFSSRDTGSARGESDGARMGTGIYFGDGRQEDICESSMTTQFTLYNVQGRVTSLCDKITPTRIDSKNRYTCLFDVARQKGKGTTAGVGLSRRGKEESEIE